MANGHNQDKWNFFDGVSKSILTLSRLISLLFSHATS